MRSSVLVVVNFLPIIFIITVGLIIGDILRSVAPKAATVIETAPAVTPGHQR